jgi:hypothetical protein
VPLLLDKLCMNQPSLLYQTYFAIAYISITAPRKKINQGGYFTIDYIESRMIDDERGVG